MMGVSGVWIGLSLGATGWSLAFGTPVLLALGVLLCATLPVASGTLFSRRLSPLGRLEVEGGAWITVATLAAASTGGAASPHVLWFVPPLMIAAVKGDTRFRLETAGFVMAGFGAAALAGASGGWVDPVSSWVLGVAYGAAILLFSAAIGLQAKEAWAPLQALLPAKRVEAAIAESADERPVLKDFAAQETRSRITALEAEVARSLQRAEEAEQKLQGRMQFFAQTSHELRTPLNAIVGFADMMVQQMFGPLAERYQEYARLIREGGRNMNAVVDDITGLARIEAGRFEIAPELVSLSDLLDEAVAFLDDMADRKGVVLDLDSNADVEGFADPRAVRQIAFNLISNAIKFTPKGGRVIVSAEETDEGAWVRVSDTGPGMTPEEMRRVLEPFGQGAAGKSEKGSGLGLSVVRAFADLHKGRVAMDSEPGAGTTVSVLFPNEAIQREA